MTKEEALRLAETAADAAKDMANTGMNGSAQIQTALAVAYATMAISLPSDGSEA